MLQQPIIPAKDHQLMLTDTTQFKPICLGNETPAPGARGQDEDCLFVNVWTPANATVESKLPVWVFIQGGGEWTSLLGVELYLV
jgi:carboxylesterase type B